MAVFSSGVSENEPLSDDFHQAIGIRTDESLPALLPDEVAYIRVVVTNRSAIPLSSNGKHPVHLGYRWILKTDPGKSVFAAVRTQLKPTLRPFSEAAYSVRIEGPDSDDWFTLQIALVQEGVRWLDAHISSLFLPHGVGS